MAEIIRRLRGHHEPQEELVFHHLLRHARSGSTFVELGCFWAYYTNWFLRAVPSSKALCIQPDLNNLAIGRENLRLNGKTAHFINACVGGRYQPEVEIIRESDSARVKLPCYDMNAVFEAANTDCIEILHMDVQGGEHGFSAQDPHRDRRGRHWGASGTRH